MPQLVNPDMIVLAREARGLSQTRLAQKLHLHKANISRLENGDTGISTQTLVSIAGATGYPPHFFFQEGGILPLHLAYRKRQHVPVKLLNPIQAHINIISRHIQLLACGLQKQVPKLPLYKLSPVNSPQKIAAQLRKKWNVSQPVIHDLAALLEQQGFIIARFDFKTERVDSRCMFTIGKYPVIFLNKKMQGDKQRFSMAYELGHLVMQAQAELHSRQDIGHQANLFAAEFLMPATHMVKCFGNGVTLPVLAQLKQIWKISMIALLYRADDVGLLSANQKRYLLQQFNEQKIRRREPPELDIAPETPKLLNQWINSFMKKHKLNQSQLCTLLAIEQHDYEAYYG